MRILAIKALPSFAIAAGLLAALPLMARSQERVVVIVNAANPVSAFSRDEASKLFLRKRTKWPNGQRVQPMDQVESSPVRRRFSDAIHRMDVWSVKSFWQESVFSGRGDPPPERAYDMDVIAFVKAHPDGLGYVSSTTPVDGVKIIVLTP
jgi:ABC-type phosphate transport system substrate-binding protein